MKTKNSTPTSEFEQEDNCPSCGNPCNIHTDLDDNDECNDCRNTEAKTNLERLPFPELVKECAEHYNSISLVEKMKPLQKQWQIEMEKSLNKQETLEEAVVIEKIAMDKLKNKWQHLYTFGYPQKPFPTNYENDLNNIKVGLYEGAKWQEQRMYSEEDMIQFSQIYLSKRNEVPRASNKEIFNYWFEQFKKK